MDMRGSEIAGIVDRDSATNRVGDLQTPAEARIGQQDSLPVRRLNRLYFGVARDFRNLEQIGTDLAPAPAMRQHLQMIGGHPS